MQKASKTPAFWHFFSTGSKEWAAGSTTEVLTVPTAPTGYLAFVIGLRTTNFNVEANWVISGAQLTLTVRNSTSAAQRATANGFVAYFNSEFII
jgi:hypothetical protein